MLCLLGLGFVLDVPTRGYTREDRPSPTESVRETPWAVQLKAVHEALGKKDVNAALRSWQEAYRAAFASRQWKPMLDVGDAYLAIGRVASDHDDFAGKAREVYLTGLLRARRIRSIEGVLKAGDAFAAIGDQAVAEQCARIAENLRARGA